MRQEDSSRYRTDRLSAWESSQGRLKCEEEVKRGKTKGKVSSYSVCVIFCSFTDYSCETIHEFNWEPPCLLLLSYNDHIVAYIHVCLSVLEEGVTDPFSLPFIAVQDRQESTFVLKTTRRGKADSLIDFKAIHAYVWLTFPWRKSLPQFPRSFPC